MCDRIGGHKTSPGPGMRRTRDTEVREKTGEHLATSLLIYLLQLHRTEQIHHPLVKQWDKNGETHPPGTAESLVPHPQVSPHFSIRPIQFKRLSIKPTKGPQSICCNTPEKSALLLTRALQHSKRVRHGKELLLQGGR